MTTLNTINGDGVVIDGCYFPSEVYRRVKDAARQAGKTRFIGVFYNPPPRDPAPPAVGMVELVNTLFVPSRGQVDLAVGAYCSYEVYESRDDVPRGVAFIAWIGPHGD